MAGRILIADDVATNRIVLKVKLATAFYDVIHADSGQQAITIAQSQAPDLIILDSELSKQDGLETCTALRAHPASQHIPILMIVGAADHAAKLAALHAGADDILQKPIDEVMLLARVRSLLRASGTENELRLRASTCRELGFAEPEAAFEHPGNIALVAARKETALLWRSQLEGKIPDHMQILSRSEALQSPVQMAAPDMFIVAGDLDKSDEGLHLLSELKSRIETRHAPVLMLLDQADTRQAVTALDMGASAVLQLGFDPEELALRVKSKINRKRQADRLRTTVQDGLRLAVIDPLTGLYNRRYALPHLGQIAERAHQTKRHFAVMILDLDRFKRINDTYGHAAGDQVLTDVAQRIRENLRAADLVARIGGEEFLIVMPDTDLEKAKTAAERLRWVVEQTPIAVSNGTQGVHATLSIGVAMGGGENYAPEALMEQADRALYAAKTDGRNQVMIDLNAA